MSQATRTETQAGHKVATNRQTLYNLTRMFPHRTPDGYMYRDKADLKRQTNAAILYVYITSSEGTHRLHESEFRHKVFRTPDGWADWFLEKVLSGTGQGTPAQRVGILRGSIIPGIEMKTSLLWQVDKVIGFSTHVI